jgi:hypothetical protein
MASTINFTDIDQNYPVAGQDNDSQGFRDNFNLIRNNFESAKTDIETLQDNTAKLNADNDFNGSKIQEAEFIKNTETVYANGNITANQNISFDFGHYQTIQVGDDITLTLADWPSSSKMARLRLQITSDGNPRTITWAVAGGGALKTHADWPNTFTVSSQTNPIIVDFWTINEGITVFAQSQGLFD